MDLNGADAQCAMLWFLMHERYRHLKDIEKIDKDIEALKSLGAELPDTLLDTFVKIPGVDYDC